jgi:uncharacterized membrane protein YgaE (UPF0421/DUF939 family)
LVPPTEVRKMKNGRILQAVTLGIAIGAVMGVAMDNVLAGIGVGVAIGIALGLAWNNHERREGKDN